MHKRRSCHTCLSTGGEIHQRVNNIYCVKFMRRFVFLPPLMTLSLQMMFPIFLLQIYFSITDSSFIHCDELFITDFIFYFLVLIQGFEVCV
ncbi:hypothetical protein Bca4012_022993 [Brassica carinata]